MFELITAGGLLMLPIIAASIAAVAIIAERFWSLQEKNIIPPALVGEVFSWADRGQFTGSTEKLESSPMGRILAAALNNRGRGREQIKEAVEDVGRHEIHELGRFLNTLGTIAAVTPLLGLLGTVVGMIKVFAAITEAGIGDPTVLAGGISEALLTTAAGMAVAIPSLIFHRYFRGRVEKLVVRMEKQALRLVDALEVRHNEYEPPLIDENEIVVAELEDAAAATEAATGEAMPAESDETVSQERASVVETVTESSEPAVEPDAQPDAESSAEPDSASATAKV